MKPRRQRQWSCVAVCKCPGWCVPLDGRTRKSGGRVTRSDHIRRMRDLVAKRVNHRDPAAYRLFLDRCSPSFVGWMLWAHRHPVVEEWAQAG